MPFLKKQFNCYCYWPSNPKSIVEFIGGSYLATKPDITYKRFIQNLVKNNHPTTSRNKPDNIKLFFEKSI